MAINLADFDHVRKLVRKHSAIVLEDEKAYLVESRLLHLARREGMASVGELLDQLRARPEGCLQRKVVEALTTNETSFFRDGLPFEALRKVVLPDLLQKRAAQRQLNIWCGGCSTGQEPFSVAMSIREHLGSIAAWKISILATDLSTEVLRRAAEGRFSQLEVKRGLPAGHLLKYFRRHGSAWLVKDAVRDMVEFDELNLLDPTFRIPPQDIVFLRNVLIYFDPATRKAVLHKVRHVLRPDGYLFLGGTESTRNLDDGFERVPFERSGCYRVRNS